VPTDGLVAWYPFNGNANDESGNGNDLFTFEVTYVDDYDGNTSSAAAFPNISSKCEVEVAPPLQEFESYSFSFRFRIDDPWSYNTFAAFTYGGSQYSGPDMAAFYWDENWFYGGCDNSSSGFRSRVHSHGTSYHFEDCVNFNTISQWRHIVMTFNDDTLRVYDANVGFVDFMEIESASADFSGSMLRVGTHLNQPQSSNAERQVDDLGVWNRELSAAEAFQILGLIAPIPGCTDSSACNFDFEATSDDGSCIYPPFVELGDDIATCEDSVFLDAGEGFTYYEWNTGDTSRSILVQEAGEYSVITSNTLPNEHALQFNGIDASAQFEESILFGVESFSVSVDCRLNAFAGNDSEPYSYIIGHPLTGGTNDHGFKIQTASNSLNGGFQVHINDEGTTHFNVISFDNSVESKVELDQWYDLTMVVDRDNALFSFYVDGVLVEAQTIHSDFGNLDHPNGLSLGIQSIHQTSLLNGYLDNLQVWDIALSEEQVAQFQTTVPSGNEEELVGFWDFEEGEGNEANEVNGSASSILLNNVGWTGDNLHSMFDFSCSAEDSIQVSFLVTGCVNPEACNYAEDALCDDGSCIPSGCMETDACNYNVLAECEGEECDYSCCPGPGCCGEGMFWDYELEQCQIFETCQEDLDGDGVIGINDLMELLSSFGTMCEEPEPETVEFTCGDPMNYHGYDYSTVQIGEQCWFAENLRTELYQNGDEVPFVEAAAQWSSLTSGARRIYGSGDANCGLEGDTIGYCGQMAESVFALNGYLYNWHTVIDSRSICPGNWHVPNDVELEVLLDEAGNDDQGAISSLKSEEGWSEGNGGSNTSGFNALGSGYGGNLGNFSSDGHFTGFWSADDTGSSANASHLQLDERPYSSSEGTVFLNTNNKRYAHSIRCIKD
jgi:uncharacterized protein (TIGR02145 family)